MISKESQLMVEVAEEFKKMGLDAWGREPGTEKYPNWFRRFLWNLGIISDYQCYGQTKKKKV